MGLFWLDVGRERQLASCPDILYWETILILFPGLPDSRDTNFKRPVNIHGNTESGSLQRDYQLFQAFVLTRPTVISLVEYTGPPVILVTFLTRLQIFSAYQTTDHLVFSLILLSDHSLSQTMVSQKNLRKY